jgi:hypothetical protein
VEIEPQAVVLNGCHERRFSDADEAEVLRLARSDAVGDLEPGVPLPGGRARGPPARSAGAS